MHHMKDGKRWPCSHFFPLPLKDFATKNSHQNLTQLTSKINQLDKKLHQPYQTFPITQTPSKKSISSVISNHPQQKIQKIQKPQKTQKIQKIQKNSNFSKNQKKLFHIHFSFFFTKISHIFTSFLTPLCSLK